MHNARYEQILAHQRKDHRNDDQDPQKAEDNLLDTNIALLTGRHPVFLRHNKLLQLT